MKKFRFRLEKVLHYRRSIQEDMKRALGARLRELKEAQEKLEQLEHEFNSNSINDAETVSIHELQIRNAYSERLKRETVRQKELIAQAEVAVEEARARYIEATQEAEVLEKLKTKKHDQYLEVVAKAEESFLDELVIQRARYTGIPKG